MPSIQDQIPRSRINLRYRTMIEGEPKEVELPFRLIIMGDLSLGSSTDCELDLETRRLRTLDGRNLDAVMENMRMSIAFECENCIDSSNTTLSVKLPIKNRTSFNPGEVANSIPELRALLLLRKLLLELQAQVDNRKEIRNLIYQIFSNPEQLAQLRTELADYAQYKLPQKTLPAAPSAAQ